ncbi:trypsin-like serine peptidase [Dactylosporangium cerinum]
MPQVAGTTDLTNFWTSKVWGGHGRLPGSTIGKLYFTEDGSRHWCTATVISSANHSTIWTAGHCVSNGNGGFYSNFVFAPDYHDALWPYGTWSAKKWAVPNGYHHGANRAYDMAALALSTNGANKRVGDVVGWQGYLFGDANDNRRWNDVRAFGYPQDTHPARSDISPYGHDLRFCVVDAVPITLYKEIECDMGHGSSGGPWIYDMPASRGWGYIVGNQSYQTSSSSPRERGPRLGRAAINAHGAVQAA